MRITTALTAALLGIAAVAPTAAQKGPSVEQIAKQAVADPTRPAEDKARDADRKPAEMLAFAGVRPGMTVIDMFPGGGYFTRLFSAAVGPTGKVIAYIPDETLARNPKAADGVNAIAATHSNVTVSHNPLMAPGPDNVADVVWTSQNYHDIHNITGVDLVALNRLILASLKPGGAYVVLDHVAPVGSGLASTSTLHRIDPATVKAEVLAAGFTFDGESKALANAADKHDLKIFDPTLRGHTDQFVYRFKKPGGIKR